MLEPDELPLAVAETADGTPPIVSIQLAGRTVLLLIRLARVGRVPLLLLDSNLPENEPLDREVTQRLYGGGHELRLQQEIVLGIGGSRALEKVGLGIHDPPHQRGPRGVRVAREDPHTSSRRRT